MAEQDIRGDESYIDLYDLLTYKLFLNEIDTTDQSIRAEVSVLSLNPQIENLYVTALIADLKNVESEINNTLKPEGNV